ncbi:MAG: glycosyltransferase family 2 protein [Bacillales bacterium]|jgi:glycosyltransferase involved in cell wall biosynthesis|nr:glycosyltransferase family 2 protein [Bacillales bacterium]
MKIDNKKVISIIVPCYNEEEVLPLYYNETVKVLNEMKVSYEIIFVDDGSKDKTKEVIKGFAKINKNIKYLIFSRNFGKEGALYAGLENSCGEYVVVMDADLQDPPELLKSMYSILQEGQYDCVGTRRITRKGEPKIRSFFANGFYKLINKMSKTKIVNGARDFRMMSRTMVKGILSLKEYNRFSKGIFSWVGFETKWLEYENIERKAGKTKWSFGKLFKYSMDGFLGFTTAPLAIASFLGTLFSIIAFLGIIAIFIRALVDPSASIDGWASTICIIGFLGGIQLLTIGILGQYMSKTYLETKNRPIYISKESNIEKDEL